jgi:hypothetical protein
MQLSQTGSCTGVREDAHLKKWCEIFSDGNRDILQLLVVVKMSVWHTL